MRAARVLACCCLLVASAIRTCNGLQPSQDNDEERLVGWRGELPPDDPAEIEAAEDILRIVPMREGPKDPNEPWVQVLSWSPRAFVYHNFLSRPEVAHILKLAAPQMKRSTVVGPNNSGVVDNIRTSAGTFLMRNQDPIISAVEERLATWVHLPRSHQEDMQVLRYSEGNKYGAHLDGLGRVMSILIYLIAPEEGGETAFPHASAWVNPEAGEPRQGNFSECAKGHVAYKPKMGDALMFYDRTVDYLSMDAASMHTGCPVVKGVKWNAVKWIHGEPFRGEAYEESLTKKSAPLPDPGLCVDQHESCGLWAEAGECENNPGFMRGNANGAGACTKSCKDCEPCDEGDWDCYNKNRERLGFMNLDKVEFQGLFG
ncbi:hypothetical protein FOA52_011067 [Chlamydomonas sp. UWO 241]|nr:hypothetical protein FOA52_011067 [Chlamydomonas sp. UWO 241]